MDYGISYSMISSLITDKNILHWLDRYELNFDTIIRKKKSSQVFLVFPNVISVAYLLADNKLPNNKHRPSIVYSPSQAKQDFYTVLVCVGKQADITDNLPNLIILGCLTKKF